MTASFNITREFLRRSHLKRLFRRWWLIAIALVLILPSVIGDLKVGGLSGTSIFALTAVLILVLRFAVSWRRSSNSIDDWVRQQGDEPVHYSFSSDSVTSKSAVGETTLKWSAFSCLKVSPFHVLLEFPRKQGALTMPTEQMNSEVLQYLVATFKKHGLRVESRQVEQVVPPKSDRAGG